MKFLFITFLLGVSASAMATYPDYSCDYKVEGVLYNETGAVRGDVKTEGTLILKKFSRNISQGKIELQGERHYELEVVLENTKVSVDFIRSAHNTNSINLNDGSNYVVYGSSETANLNEFKLDLGGNDGRVRLNCIKIVN
ncbi:MAG: hypothetical protein PHY93_17185 [Bacteriovorax sp.]|nr:hypothetical protein [Bacteriovorax sp.]